MTERALELTLPPAEAMVVLRQAVDEWGGGFGEEEPVEFAVPINAGLRHGYARFRPLVDETASGSRLRLELQDQVLRVNRSAAMVLALGAVGGILTVLWPLHPALTALAPLGAVLALLAWLMVASRFRSRGPDELLATVAEIAGDRDDSTG